MKPKLVRDRIPELISIEGRIPQYHTIESGELYLQALIEKLDEEIKEFEESKNLDELSDILEVVYALAAYLGVEPMEVEAIRQKKRSERGGFDRRVFLDKIVSP